MGDNMIRKFEVENFKNFRDKFTLDLTKTKNYEFNEDAIQNNIINKALIYGRNGVGKTNLGLAIFDITLVLDDKPRLPLRFYDDYMNAEGKKDYVEFRYEFQFNEDIVEYYYKKKDIDELIYEELIVNGEQVIVFNFETMFKEINIKSAKTLNFEFKDNNLSVVKYIVNNSNLDKNDPIIKLVEFVKNMLWFQSFQDNRNMGLKAGDEVFSSTINKLELLNDFELFLNDFGLEVNLSFIDSDNKKLLAFNYGNKKINFFKNASSGTRDLAWFYYWFIGFSNTSFLYIDEFDAYFHYELALNVVKVLSKFSNMQTILTSHNTSLITNKELRPDCYFILSKSNLTNLPNATQKELREAHNLEKMFRSGEFEF